MLAGSALAAVLAIAVAYGGRGRPESRAVPPSGFDRLIEKNES
jgi:hypothetical protein